MTVMFSALAFVCGIFFVISPVPVPIDKTPDSISEPPNAAVGETAAVTPPAIVTEGINAYIDDFTVEILPWTPSSLGERVRVNIVNIGSNTYDWTMLNVIFLNDTGSVIGTIQGGAYSQIRPNDAVNIYMSADGMENARGFVYSVETDRFIDDPEMGVISNY